jgi:hypothetical protein
LTLKRASHPGGSNPRPIDVTASPTGTLDLQAFEAALDTLPIGYSEGRFEGHRYGVTLAVSEDRKRITLFGRQLGGTDLISFNLYRLTTGKLALKPCEMPAAKVIAFVEGYAPQAPD